MMRIEALALTHPVRPSTVDQAERGYAAKDEGIYESNQISINSPIKERGDRITKINKTEMRGTRESRRDRAYVMWKRTTTRKSVP
ncbi:hypothetical protein BDN71DRAFT_1451897 [Pleurotus eryngii]|uniref:Uncharacterized protein n=1 Tax=Pleurotus eryngii TaxID=5323 RepID=A0A9P5ZRK5_PLEER|nr:hypothetical protein BDN71DRAFT_1451897 [Pleurotus eryngii]